MTGAAVHHVEIWTTDLDGSVASWDWLFDAIGWRAATTWQEGRSWAAADGSYVVVEQSPAVIGSYDRMRAGLNHLAMNVADRAQLDQIRSGAAEHGWNELFAERYPFAGGPDHVALYLENREGFEIELVARPENR
jgi:hypothetical protein